MDGAVNMILVGVTALLVGAALGSAWADNRATKTLKELQAQLDVLAADIDRLERWLAERRVL